jgi:hypothetical protein
VVAPSAVSVSPVTTALGGTLSVAAAQVPAVQLPVALPRAGTGGPLDVDAGPSRWSLLGLLILLGIVLSMGAGGRARLKRKEAGHDQHRLGDS